jgi:hypothetical protein
MNKTKKLLVILITLILSSVFFPAKVFAGFGVSPAIIKNEYLKPGSHFEKEIFLSRSDPDEDLEILVEPDLEEMSQWIKFEPGNKFIFKKGENLFRLKAIFDIPQDAPYKRFSGAIRVKAQDVGGAEQGGVSVVKGARLEVNLVTTEIDITDLSVRAIKVLEEVQPGEPLKIGLTIENTGNTPAAPRCEIEITTLNSEPLETIESEPIEMVPAMQVKEVVALFHPSEGEGEYFGNVKVFIGSKVLREDKVVFKVLGAAAPAPTTASSEETPASGFISNIRIPKEFLLPTVAGVLFLAIVVGLIVAGLKTQNKVRKLIFLIAAGAIILVSLTVGVTVLIVSNLGKVGQQQAAETQEEQVMGTFVEEQSLEPTPAVESAESKSPFTPLVVIDPDGEQLYNVYNQPDMGSAVVYTALEGEELTVLEEQARWYRVELPGGASGWIPKENIKRNE